jgi:hypothetical protein
LAHQQFAWHLRRLENDSKGFIARLGCFQDHETARQLSTKITAPTIIAAKFIFISASSGELKQNQIVKTFTERPKEVWSK